MAKNFAIVGAAGYVAPRHLRAIRETSNELVAALDVSDSAGILDAYFPAVPFFTTARSFEEHLRAIRERTETSPAHFVTVCSPNHLHLEHCRLALDVGADVVCEKPLALEPSQLALLEEAEAMTGRSIFTVLQLRAHPTIVALRERIAREAPNVSHDVLLTYVTPRGPWYDVSWKGDASKSGGIPTNIGIHLFDLLLWLFGPLETARVHLREPRRMSGFLELERARVRWFLSIEQGDLPSGTGTPKRSLRIDGDLFDFSDGFSDLHTRVYEEILAGRGCGIDLARPSIDLAYRLRHAPLSHLDDTAHPRLGGDARG